MHRERPVAVRRGRVPVRVDWLWHARRGRDVRAPLRGSLGRAARRPRRRARVEGVRTRVRAVPRWRSVMCSGLRLTFSNRTHTNTPRHSRSPRTLYFSLARRAAHLAPSASPQRTVSACSDGGSRPARAAATAAAAHAPIASATTVATRVPRRNTDRHDDSPASRISRTGRARVARCREEDYGP